jgi:hypothetical protein
MPDAAAINFSMLTKSPKNTKPTLIETLRCGRDQL